MIKYIDEFRDKRIVARLAEQIRQISRKECTLMEVCGGHTAAIQKYGIPSLLPTSIRLVSGPGCPVCVSSRQYLDKAIALSRRPGIIITTFGDLMRVPGSTSSLEKEKARGGDIRMVYSILDALRIAGANQDKKVVFLAIGFETTAPGTAAGIIRAKETGTGNFFVFSTHKIMPPAMEAIINEGIRIHGYIAPGHVTAITGTGMYSDLCRKYKVGVVVSGFEPVDLLQSVKMLVEQVETGNQRIEIQYKRAVRPRGNEKARALMEKVFEPRDDWWRGLGILKNSGLKIRDGYGAFDAERMTPVEAEPLREAKGCICGEVLKGLKNPAECMLFASVCTPDDPVGACMVSSEGACQAHYRFNRMMQ
jgi:hydrogenase expression/formation protein HypD